MSHKPKTDDLEVVIQRTPSVPLVGGSYDENGDLINQTQPCGPEGPKG